MTNQISDLNNSECANCEQPVNGNYCQQCGQPTQSRRAPLLAVFREALDEFNLDNKFFRSLWSLFSAPGELTLKFIKGKRYSMLPPFRMYLVISIVFLFIFEIPTPNVENTNFYFKGQLIGREAPDPDLTNFQLLAAKSPVSNLLEELLKERTDVMAEMDPQDLVERLIDSMNNALSQVLILFIPVLALMMKLLLSKKHLYYDHLIFALHFQSWLFLWILGCYYLAELTDYAAFALLLVPVYLYFSLRKVYQPKLLMSFVNLALIGVSYLVTLYIALAGSVLYVIATIPLD